MYAGSSSLGRVDPARLGPYIALLIGTKGLRSFGLFLAYDILKVVHLIVFVFIIKVGSAAVLLPLQRPFSSGKRLTKRQWIRVFRHSIFGTLITLLWIFGLTLCGPVRTIVLYEHSDVVISAVVAALFTNRGGGPGRTRGAFMFVVGILGLLIFDADQQLSNSDHPEGLHTSAITHIYYKAISWLGVSDHKGGVLLLVVLLFTNVAYKNTSKKLSVDVGGAKRLHALSTLLSAAMLCPWAMFHLFMHESRVVSWMSLFIPLTTIILLLFIIDYYVESVSVNRLEIFKTARYSAYTLCVSALVLGYIWSSTGTEAKYMEHAVSGGVIFTTILFIFATKILGNPVSKSKGSLVGYTAAGLPLYNFTGDTLQRTSQSIMMISKNILKQILEASDSRQIFFYLCINLAFTFVELIYGVLTNSLGLISDGFHMLFDCTALVVGLTAAVMTHWKATRMFSYGFGRVEILSGFVNGLFLVVISWFVFMAAIGRILDPPEVNTDKLLTVSVAGLLVNLIGIFVFHNAGHSHSHGGVSHGHSHGGGGHAHGGGGGHGHGSGGGHGHGSHGHEGSGHGHSHGGGGHGHGGGGHGHGHGGGHGHSNGHESHDGHLEQNSNMQGVFLHVLADTMGSVGVIISSLLIDQFGLLIADPICSMFIAIMIFISVMPLLRDTAAILLQRIPVELEHCMSEGLNKVRLLDGVLGYKDQHFWRHSGSTVAGTLHVRIGPQVSEQKIIQQVAAIFKEYGVTNFTVQVEKEEFFQHMSGLSATFDRMLEMTHQMEAIPKQDDLYDIKAV